MAADMGMSSVARVITLEELLRHAWTGRLRIPDFRRSFSWSRQDVIRLVDSVLHGYPVGSLLLWERPAEEERVTLGALAVDAPAIDRALWVVDGQQRVVSLANVLHPDGRVDERLALGYGLRSGQVVALSPQGDPFVIPLPTLFDLTRLLTWFADRQEAGDYRQSAFELARNLREFALPAYQIVEDDVRVVQTIFDRLNSTGRSLTRAEIFSATHVQEGNRVALDVDRIAEEIDERLRFGRIDGETVLQCILARRGPDVHRDVRSEFDPGRGRGRGRLPRRSARNGLRPWLRGARARCPLHHRGRRPAPYFPALPLSPRAPDTVPRSAPGAASARAATAPSLVLAGHRGWSRGGSRQHLRCSATTRPLHGGNRRDGVALLRLLAAVGDDPPVVPDPHRFKVNTAEGKLVLCSWWHLAPRRPDTGERYTRSDIAAAVEESATVFDAVRWIFPVRFAHTRERRWAADRVLMPVVDESLAEVSGLLQHRPRHMPEDLWAAVLASHLISGECEQLLQTEDVVSFVEQRHSDVVGHLRRFLSLVCEWGFENTPPLVDLELDDLDDELDVAR